MSTEPSVIFAYVVGGFALGGVAVAGCTGIRVAVRMKDVNTKGSELYFSAQEAKVKLNKAETDFKQLEAARPNGDPEARLQAIRSLDRALEDCSILLTEYEELRKEGSSSWLGRHLWKRAQKSRDTWFRMTKAKTDSLKDFVADRREYGNGFDTNAPTVPQRAFLPAAEAIMQSLDQLTAHVTGRSASAPTLTLTPDVHEHVQGFVNHEHKHIQRSPPTYEAAQQQRNDAGNTYEMLPLWVNHNGQPNNIRPAESHPSSLKGKRITAAGAVAGCVLGFFAAGPVGAGAGTAAGAAAASEYVDHRRERRARPYGM